MAQSGGRVEFKTVLNFWRPFVWPLFFWPIKMTPNKEQFIKYAATANVVPVYTELLADMETPVSTYSKLEGFDECFLLESAENVDNWGRYSFIGCNAKAVFALNGKKGVLKFAAFYNDFQRNFFGVDLGI